MTKAAVHDTQQSHSICENQRRCRDRAGRLDLARSFPRAGRPPLKSHRRPAGRPMVLECTIHARRQRRKRWKRIYTDGARGAGSLRGALTGNDVRLIWRLAKTRLLAVAQVPKNTTAPWLSRLNGRRGNGNGLGWRPRSTIRPTRCDGARAGFQSFARSSVQQFQAFAGNRSVTRRWKHLTPSTRLVAPRCVA